MEITYQVNGEEQHFYGVTVITVGHVPPCLPGSINVLAIASYKNYAKN